MRHDPPENRNAPGANRGVGRDRPKTFRDHLDSQSLPRLQELIFTTAPDGLLGRSRRCHPRATSPASATSMIG
jgi:hypothetical protein